MSRGLPGANTTPTAHGAETLADAAHRKGRRPGPRRSRRIVRNDHGRRNKHLTQERERESRIAVRRVPLGARKAGPNSTESIQRGNPMLEKIQLMAIMFIGDL